MDMKTKYFCSTSLKNGNFEVCKWFMTEYSDLYETHLDITKGRTYELNGQNFINLFQGFLHTKRKVYDSYSPEIKRKVDLIWKHIEEIWCSSDKQQFIFVKNWISFIVDGKKNKSMLYLKSGQGTGKSIIVDFICQKVLGQKITYKSARPDAVISNFNHEIVGKVLFVLEEMPSSSTSGWISLSNSLKEVVTGNTISDSEKHKTPKMVQNVTNIILCSNHNALKIDNDDRRIFMPDISTKRIGQAKYFENLAQIAEEDKVGEAFYWYCKEQAQKNLGWNDAIKPRTKNKEIIISDNLPSVISFYKDRFLLKNEAVSGFSTEIYQEFVNYCKRTKDLNTKDIVKNCSFYQETEKIFGPNSVQRRVSGNKTRICISHEEMKCIYKEKGWINKYDDLDEDEEEDKEIKFFEALLVEMKAEDIRTKAIFAKDESDESDEETSGFSLFLKNLD